MSKPGQSSEGAPMETTATTVVEPKPKRRVARKTGKNALAIGAAALGVAHVLVEGPKEEAADEVVKTSKKPAVEARESLPHPEWKRSAIGEVLNETVFESERSTGGIQDDFVDLFKTVFDAKTANFFYYDARGNVLLTAEQPEELRLLKASNPGAYKVRLQAWHNENRRAISADAVTPTDFASAGYPFVSSPTLPGIEEMSEASTLIEVVMERLEERTRSTGAGPSYFGGKERSIYDGIVEIAKAYDLPRALVLGIAANESGYDQNAISPDDARGIFQFTAGGFADAKAYAAAHPELGASIRKGAIGTFETSWKNRFVSAEMFCAYYRLIREQLRPKIEKLEERLRSIDPSYPAGTLLEISSINAYNGGPKRIMDCVDRFLSLSDGEMRAHIGKPPYGVDAWLAVTALSFGLTVGKTSTKVKNQVFLYPQKVLAMGALIMEEENYLSGIDRARDQVVPAEPVPAEPAENPPPSRRGLWNSLIKTTGVTGALAGFASIADTTRNEGSQPTEETRRSFMKKFLASVGLAAPFVRKGRELLGSESENPEEETAEPYADSVEGDAARSLDALDLVLRQRAADGLTGWTPDEDTEKKLFHAPENRALLLPEFEDMLGKDLIRRLDRGGTLAEKKKLYAEAGLLQNDYVAREIKKGSLVPVSADDPANAFFCEQVGKGAGGIGNSPEALYMRKEFLLVIPAIVTLVNRQIDAFNANPETYGIRDPNFPVLPHISALKISSMLRPTSVTGDMMSSGRSGATTASGMTPHWLGSAIDIASYATRPWKDKVTGEMVGAMGHMARLDGDLYDAKGGTVMVPAGGLLDNGGFGTRTREILSMMTGRALFALREPLERREKIIIQPLWEAGQLNWHIALDVIEPVAPPIAKP